VRGSEEEVTNEDDSGVSKRGLAYSHNEDPHAPGPELFVDQGNYDVCYR